jgi:hypothetical protein
MRAGPRDAAPTMLAPAVNAYDHPEEFPAALLDRDAGPCSRCGSRTRVGDVSPLSRGAVVVCRGCAEGRACAGGR